MTSNAGCAPSGRLPTTHREAVRGNRITVPTFAVNLLHKKPSPGAAAGLFASGTPNRPGHSLWPADPEVNGPHSFPRGHPSTIPRSPERQAGHQSTT